VPAAIVPAVTATAVEIGILNIQPQAVRGRSWEQSQGFGAHTVRQAASGRDRGRHNGRQKGAIHVVFSRRHWLKSVAAKAIIDAAAQFWALALEHCKRVNVRAVAQVSIDLNHSPGRPDKTSSRGSAPSFGNALRVPKSVLQLYPDFNRERGRGQGGISC
jgi:hypothetical protein